MTSPLVPAGTGRTSFTQGAEDRWNQPIGYLTLAYEDVAAYALLTAILIRRPHGLFGHPERLANDRFCQRPL